MKTSSENRRQKKYIDRQTQGRVTLIVVLNAFFYIFLLALLIFVPLAFRIYTDSVTPELLEAANAFLTFHKYFWPAILILLVFIGFHSIRISHKMAGPVFRFKASLRGIQNKDLTKNITLRRGDFFVDLMEEINKTTVSLRESLHDLEKKDEKLREGIEHLSEKLDNGEVSVEELKRLALSIRESEDGLRQWIGAFHIEKGND